MTAPPRHWLSVAEASSYFGLRPKNLYLLIARGQLPAVAIKKFGRLIRINVELIEQGAAELKGRKP